MFVVVYVAGMLPKRLPKDAQVNLSGSQISKKTLPPVENEKRPEFL